MKKIALLLIILSFSVLLFSQEQDMKVMTSNQYNATINDVNVRIRKEPHLDAEIIQLSVKDEEVEIIGRTFCEQVLGDQTAYWIQIKTKEGKIGWSYGYYIDYQGEIKDLKIIRDVKFLPNSEEKADVQSVKIYEQNPELEIVVWNDCELVYINDNNIIQSARFLNKFEKVIIKHESYFNGLRINGIRYYELIDDEQIYISDQDVLFFPLLCTLKNMETEGTSYDINKYYNNNDETVSLSSWEPYYFIYEIEEYDNKYWMGISDDFYQKHTNGWIQDQYIEIDYQLSKIDYLKHNLFAFMTKEHIDKSLESFGLPKAQYIINLNNRFSDIDDIEYLHKYDGLLVDIKHFVEVDKYNLVNFEIDNNNYPINDYFYIGMPKANVLRLLGEVDFIDENNFNYNLDMDNYTQFLYFFYEDDIITQIGFQYVFQ